MSRLLRYVLPSRFSLEVFGCLAAMIAFGLDDMHRRRPKPKFLTSRVFAGALLTAAVITLLPAWPYPTQSEPALPQPESILPAALRTAIPARDPVTITYPYVTDFAPLEPLEWQMDDRYSFRLLGGYAHVTNPNGELVTTTSPHEPSGPTAISSCTGVYEKTFVAVQPRVGVDHPNHSVQISRSTGYRGPIRTWKRSCHEAIRGRPRPSQVVIGSVLIVGIDASLTL